MRSIGVTRIRVITALFLFIFILLIARLYQLQVVRHEFYTARAEQQYVHTVETLYSRGSIYFTAHDGNTVSAATIASGFVLSLNPTEIVDPELLYEALAPYVEITRDEFIHRATLPERTYVEIASRLSSDDAEEIRDRALPGVHLYQTQWRYYPGGNLAARIIGFVGFESRDDKRRVGLYGLERMYEETLSRGDQKLSVNFFAELFSNLGSFVFDARDTKQGSVVTTIEPTVARMLQDELTTTHNEWRSNFTGAIIMRPKTGEIIALDAVPSVDLNDRSGAEIEVFKNPLVENVYEFGSIVKALTVASGLDSGAITAESTYYDSGFLELDEATIRNFDGRGRGTVNMQEVLNQSLNTGVAHIVSEMGKDEFRTYFLSLKLGSETGIDLPNETFGLVDNLNSPRDVEYATASFGQGIATTPIAMVRALAALANGGVLVTPHIASRIEYEHGRKKKIAYPDGERVFKEETSTEISRMLTTVVDDALSGGDVALPNYRIAAKTGTAQIPDPEAGGYYEDRFLHSFFGYFPAYNPEYLIFLYTVEPRDVRYASETLTEPFMNIARFLINYYAIPPDRV